MTQQTVQTSFFIILFAAVVALTLTVYAPFVTVIATAAVFAALLHPLFRRFNGWFKGYATLAALATIAVAVVLLLLPLSLLGVQLFQESKSLYDTLRSGDTGSLEEWMAMIEQPIQRYFPSFDLNIRQYSQQLAGWLGQHAGSVITGAASGLLNTLLFFIALFFFIRDGAYFRKAVVRLSPLKDEDDRRIIAQLGKAVDAVVRGALLVALIQGFLSGIGMAIFNVPNATLWGALAAIGALVPGVGTAIVLAPAIIYLFVAGQPGMGFGLLVWGSTAVGLVDNILTPYFYGQGIKVHPLPVLFAVLGGLALFGPLGFIFGPLVLSLYFALLETYPEFVQGAKKI